MDKKLKFKLLALSAVICLGVNTIVTIERANAREDIVRSFAEKGVFKEVVDNDEEVMEMEEMQETEEVEEQKVIVPKVVKVEQLDSKTLEVTYDRPVELKKATDPANYWIQSITNDKATGIATLGSKDEINSKNSLTADTVTITPKDKENQVFLFNFQQDISNGEEYNFIAYYVTEEGGKPYNGDNGTVKFIGENEQD